MSNRLTRVLKGSCQTVCHVYENTCVKPFDTCIFIQVSNLTHVYQYTCQNVQLVTCTSNTRLTRVKMHMANCLTRVQCCTHVKIHVANLPYFCRDCKQHGQQFSSQKLEHQTGQHAGGVGQKFMFQFQGSRRSSPSRAEHTHFT